MSGGVDSSVAAALLRDAGHEVAGVSINVFSCDRATRKSCCSARDREDARRVCESLGLPHMTIDRRASFGEEIVEPFVREYAEGKTPSPCVRCNELVKFRALIEEAERLGFDAISTGHYARTITVGSQTRLARGADETKDQSYFLFRLAGRDLEKTIFPLGDISKNEVRRIAGAMSLPVSEKTDSQEICFVPDGDCAAFVESRAGASLKGPGNFVDSCGRVLGRHRGIHAYTIGQRRGLGFGVGVRQYVVRIDPERNEVVLGEDRYLFQRKMRISALTWAGEEPGSSFRAMVRIRSTHAGAPASVELLDDRSALVCFDEPVRAIAPGQAAVFYEGDVVRGGGTIEAVVS